MAIKFRTNEDFVTTIDVLNSCAEIFKGWAEKEYNTLVEARRIIERVSMIPNLMNKRTVKSHLKLKKQMRFR